MQQILSQVAERLATYRATKIKSDILETDEMFVPGVPGALDHYFSVGRSAINMITQAMVLTGKTRFEAVLDLPCGAGRITRHLSAFFYDSKIFVAELDKQKEAFVVEKFGATPIRTTADFSLDPDRRFDLVFVGSLLTHLNAASFERALEWFIKAVADDGVLVFTTHGRRHDFVERKIHRTLDLRRWNTVANDYAQTGFGYIETESKADSSYGISWSAPSWIMRLLENDPRIRIVAFQEAAWDNHQDVVVLQRRPLDR